MGGRTERTGQPDRAVPLKPEGENLRPAMVRQGQRVGLGTGGPLCRGGRSTQMRKGRQVRVRGV